MDGVGRLFHGLQVEIDALKVKHEQIHAVTEENARRIGVAEQLIGRLAVDGSAAVGAWAGIYKRLGKLEGRADNRTQGESELREQVAKNDKRIDTHYHANVITDIATNTTRINQLNERLDKLDAEIHENAKRVADLDTRSTAALQRLDTHRFVSHGGAVEPLAEGETDETPCESGAHAWMPAELIWVGDGMKASRACAHCPAEETRLYRNERYHKIQVIRDWQMCK